jgi:hypothetical protein
MSLLLLLVLVLLGRHLTVTAGRLTTFAQSYRQTPRSIRHLQEQRVAMAESSAGAHSKDLGATITQLRQELRTQAAAASAAAFRQQVPADMRSAQVDQDKERGGAASGRDR